MGQEHGAPRAEVFRHDMLVSDEYNHPRRYGIRPPTIPAMSNKVRQDSSAKTVRQKLAQISGKEEWERPDFWRRFLVCWIGIALLTMFDF